MEPAATIRCVALLLFVTLSSKFGACSSFERVTSNHQTRSRRQVVTLPHFYSRNITFGLGPGTVPEYGPWGPWTVRSECSRSCGGGIAYQDRICTNIRIDGVHSCSGAYRRYVSCNTQDCPKGTKDFRDVQCARFNSVPYRGKYYRWVPYYKASNPCELNCKTGTNGFYSQFARKVIDGTHCYKDGSLDTCVDGICVPVGCDKALGSSAREDSCGVCGGDGSSCSLVKGLLDRNDFEYGYNDILLIPKGATTILIEEVQPTNNYLAMRNSAGKFFLNGNWQIENTREIDFAGTLFHYKRKLTGSRSSESLQSRGPTSEPIFIVLLYQEENLGFSYEYSVPFGVTAAKPDSYLWRVGDFEECSQTCGGGVQYRPVHCIRNSDRDIVAENLCDLAQKPSVNMSCNDHPCPARWQIGEWSNCSHPCGGGSQFRLVFCHQIKNGKTTVLVPDEECSHPKPLFMRTCNEDKECPKWVTSDWSQCDSSCGTGNRTRQVECRSADEDSTLLNDSECNAADKPPTFQQCSLGPCEGVEWIISDWSGCEGTCSASMESREAHCANEDGVVFPDESCDPARLPELTRTCPVSPVCEPMWHTSEWTECSAKCGTGVQTRVVFCGVWEDNAVIKIDDSKCVAEKKFSEVQNCSSASCKGVWFTGPWNRCSSPCGGGERSRKILCFYDDEVVELSRCDDADRPFDKEPCNMHPCDGDEVMVSGGCKNSKYGCCADGVTPAGGENFEGCPQMKVTPDGSCEEAEFGCCADGITLALGPFKKGCTPSIPCNATKYGCCSDQVTEAQGLGGEGCPEISECYNTTFGCCPDGITAAEGKDLLGCEVITVCPDCFNDTMESSGEDCTTTEHGCCPDGLTPATGPDHEECPEDVEASLTPALECALMEFGCCEDNFTAAKGPNDLGCDSDEGSGDVPEVTDCQNSFFGCCPDNVTFAKGMDGEGCEAINCTESEFGCCPDNTSFALGPDGEGCPEISASCINTTFGCCPDNVTTALGLSGEGCLLEISADCQNTTYGCCPDNITVAQGADNEGCPGVAFTCENSTYGCCPDNISIVLGPDNEGCLETVISCENSTYGCCPDNVSIALGPDNEGCPETTVSCENSTYGCCPDNISVALGPDSEGCPETTVSCENSTYGCCPDNISVSLGPDNEGCPETNVSCENSTYGCCPDKISHAQGPDNEGCPEITISCENNTYGCCPDNISFALGPDNEGCPETTVSCENSTYGCCPDNVTSAQGPDGEGCEDEILADCHFSTYGCCPDNITESQGSNFEGCLSVDCQNSKFGCCPDNITFAKGKDAEGCELLPDCKNSTFGCCPDNSSVASGPNYEGCEAVNCSETVFGCCPDGITVSLSLEDEGCLETIITTEPATTLSPTTLPEEDLCSNTLFGCCPDGRTVAQGPNLQGCCFGLRFGCCPDNMTAALGPNFLGCGCQTYPYGCCPDGITPAQGHRYYGCRCEHFRYGCCQDHVTPASGPNFEGCVCEQMRYGCCPDGKTPQTGPNGEGCEECLASQYGCCPDGHTPATSPDLSGCPCESFVYGCCPDGRTPSRSPDPNECSCQYHRYGCCQDQRTPASGPNYEGCPCETTYFGCCRDGRTPAQGLGLQGCPCEISLYGCCADGITHAQGPNLFGCPPVEEPPIRVSADVCGLPKEHGPCHNYTVKWFFDVVYGGCSRFWYGGCEGNGNVFATQEDCEAVCVSPEGKGVCLLPRVSGPCEGKYQSWYYDVGSQSCESFTYSGCLGNNNRFPNKEVCQQTCMKDKKVDAVDVCTMPKDEGPCDGTILHWYYNSATLRCEQFYYGGCHGNNNRFQTRADCERKCLPTTDRDSICTLPQDRGTCYNFRERWFFDHDADQCRQFYYSGCGGNANNFGSYIECEQQCIAAPTPEPTEEEFTVEFCELKPEPGPCTQKEIRWFYDKNDGVCREFTYGGCNGNRNKFLTKAECETACGHSQDVCQLPKAKGPCSGSFIQWYYDSSQDTCFEFEFGGCKGNANRFNSLDNCERQCKKQIPTTVVTLTADDVCFLPQEPGPCLGYYRMWYYDGSENMCKSFVYGGCDGNENRFEKRTECEQKCVKKKKVVLAKVIPTASTEGPTDTNEDVCRMPADPGPCNERHPRWFYDSRIQTCQRFDYSGCGGNKNRFKTVAICSRFCSGIVSAATSPSEPPMTTPSTTAISILETEPPCPRSNCADIQCPFGIEEVYDAIGCSTCRCSNPCEALSCPEGQRCAIQISRSAQGSTRTEPVCREVRKAGECPSVVDINQLYSPGSRQRLCDDHCRDDADCRSDEKCCHNGCAFVCLEPSKIEETTIPPTPIVPANILPGLTHIVAIVGSAALLPCNAYGNPRPTVTWWRQAVMLPQTSHRYEQRPDYSMLIRSIILEDMGEYSCEAHNGIGPGAVFRVTLAVEVHQPAPSSQDSHITGTHGILQPDAWSPGHEDLPHPVPAEDHPLWNNVPVSAKLVLVTDPVAGSPLQLDCQVQGPPPGPQVMWQFQGIEIGSSERWEIYPNNSLFIAKAEMKDSGEYTCTAQLGGSTATSSVSLSVKDPSIPADCKDSPRFAHCEMIVQTKYCNNKYYGKFCCQSCMRAGQLTRWPLD